VSNELFVLFDQSRQEAAYRGIAPLFDTVLASVNASAAFLYAADDSGGKLQLRFARSSAGPGFIDRLAVAFRDDDARFLNELQTPLDARPADDRRIEKFPEVLQYRFGRLLVVPLRADQRLLGLLTVGRAGAHGFDIDEAASVAALARTLGAGLRNDQLNGDVSRLSKELDQVRRRTAELERKLEERKVIERAKGLLQEQGLTEEAAYFQIRVQSRRRRVNMAEVAREIIAEDEATQPVALAQRMTA